MMVSCWSIPSLSRPIICCWNTDFPGEEVLAAIDHHPPRRSKLRAKIHDVRPEVGRLLHTSV